MRSIASFLMAIAAALVLNLSALSAGLPAPYSGIVVFGTSLSDPGNGFALRGGINHPPEYLLDALLGHH